MSDEWNLEEGNVSDQEQVSDMNPQTADNTETTPTQSAEEPSVIEQPVESTGEQRETYHWVNPEYQKRQQGTADAGNNTYENNSYRENVAGQTDNGYRGGSYHDWQNQNQSDSSQSRQENGDQNQSWNSNTNQNQSWQSSTSQGTGPATGQRRYGDYQFTPNRPVKTPKKKRNQSTGKKFLVTIGLAVVFGVVAGGVMFGVNSLGNHLTGQNKASQIQIPSTETPETKTPDTKTSDSATVSVVVSDQYTVAEVASICMPSVVSITNASVKTVKDFFGGVQQYPIESSGSGIIVGQNDKELLIATNNHVVEGADTITVAFTDDAVYGAQIKGNAADSDLAVIAVKLDDMSEETLNSIRVVTLGNSDSLQIGEQVVAIGNALGYGQSVTSGWVSAVDREMEDENGKSTGKLIQTDAAINPGNSGGALLNMRGELIGINSAKAAATEVEGMGYAIPIATAQPILDELMNRETRYKASEDKAAYIGVTCMSVEADASKMYGIPTGAFVDSVEEGGPAEAAGIQKGDVIVKFDGITITGSTELVSKLEYYEAGETVDVVISRAENGEYKEQTVSVTLGKRSEMKQSVDR